MDEIPIGRFARLTGLTVKALRHYDAIGLLRPAAVDPRTRHRRYAADQVERAVRIGRLRALDLPLEQVAAVLAAPDGGPTQLAVGEWQCARVYSVLGRAEPALHHARRCAAIAAAEEVEDWVVASAHEALTRAYAVAGDRAPAVAERERAVAACARITDPEEREIVENDLAGIAL